jgi:hypothetical protein
MARRVARSSAPRSKRLHNGSRPVRGMTATVSVSVALIESRSFVLL